VFIFSLHNLPQSTTSLFEKAKDRISLLEAELATVSQNHTNAVAESAAAASSSAEQVTKLRSDLAAAKSAQKSAEGSINDLKVCVRDLAAFYCHVRIHRRSIGRARKQKRRG
jgi:hypothetical protein